MDLIDRLMPPLLDIVDMLLPLLADLLLEIIPPIADLITDLVPVLLELFEMLIPVITELVQTLLPVLVEIFEALAPVLLPVIIDLLPPLLDLIKALLPVVKILGDAIAFLAGIFSGVLAGAIDLVMPMFDFLLGTLSGLINFITSVFKGDWEGAWNAITDIFENAFGIIPRIAGSIVNAVIDVINGILSGINAVGSMFGINITLIPKVDWGQKKPQGYKAGLEFVPEDEFPAMLHYGEMVLTREEADKYRNMRAEDSAGYAGETSWLGMSGGITGAVVGGGGGNTQRITLEVPLKINSLELTRVVVDDINDLGRAAGRRIIDN